MPLPTIGYINFIQTNLNKLQLFDTHLNGIDLVPTHTYTQTREGGGREAYNILIK